ncbi:hypothetical protein F5B19DRAFT_244620 [Rostrohypoxylon terebratum]|nr:hypothetical protein F5B19DRAFT_244620 [Rostrohypoxylon terebratum]
MFPSNPFDNTYQWAISHGGQLFRDTAIDSLMGNLAPDQFILTILALLSYYRILNANNVFVPIQNCEAFFSEFLNMVDFRDVEQTGTLLERVAFAAIGIGRSLRSKVVAVPYLKPFQLRVCMEDNLDAVRLNIYCSARIAKCCSHKAAVDSMKKVFEHEDTSSS